jgi:DNA-binding NarL/FixJ family response regulator
MIRLLLVDDHAMLLDGLTALFRTAHDIEIVGQARDGRAAVSEAVARRPDVVLMDVAMPGLNGIDATPLVRSRAPQSRVLIVSMHSSADHLFRALRAGASGYILKESAGSEAISAVRSVHAGRRYIGEGLRDLEMLGSRERAHLTPLERLSAREREVMQLVVEGHSSAGIAARMKLSQKTVETYRSRLMGKLGVPDVTALVKFALLHGLTPLDWQSPQ